MERERFSLLLLDPGEIYFRDLGVILITPDVTSKTYDFKKQEGRLKICSKSVVFDPKHLSKPLIKIPLRDCQIIEKWKGKSKFIKSDNVLHIVSNRHVEMLEGNEIAPYKYCDNGMFLFLLNYLKIDEPLALISQLHRANSLPPAEHANMITAVVSSYRKDVVFDPKNLDLYEKVVLEVHSNKISPLVVSPGIVLLTNCRLYFQPFTNVEKYRYLKINLDSIRRVVKRRFLLRHIGLEIYYSKSDKIAYIYLSLENENNRNNLYTKLLEQDLQLDKTDKDVMTLQWQNRIVSNYDYLLYLNNLGDRTINDLTQYPVLPWVISDYSSSNLDLNNAKSYRDLSKPIGALNNDRLQKLIERYEEMPEPKYLYGSHYSTPGFVLFYLTRLYPNYMLCLQNGRFDMADRMFNSMADVYKNCLNNMSDFKELIPHFYDVEEEGKFLVNNMGINFGHRENGDKVGDVKLPPWAENPKHFVTILRNALESDIVSENLHSWIDLIFGYKQRGDEAAKARNVFNPMCYEGNIDLDSILDINDRHRHEVQIMEFGQVPKQVFNVPHPQRKVRQILLEPFQVSEDSSDCDMYSYWKNLKKLALQKSFLTHKGPVSSLFITNDCDRIVSAGHDSRMKIFSVCSNGQIRSADIGSMPLSSCIELADVNTLIIGSWDNSINIYDLQYCKVTHKVEAHKDAITCMKWGDRCHLLCSGSSDCTVRIWKAFNKNGIIKPIEYLLDQLDHNSEVTCLDFDPDNTHLAVGTKDGEIYIWKIPENNLYCKYQVHESTVSALNYSPDGQKLVSCSTDKTFKILDIGTGMSLYTKSINAQLCCLKLDGFILLLGDANGELYIWDILEVKLLHQQKLHSGPINTVDVSKNNKFIVTGGDDNQICVWTPEKFT